MLQIKKTDRFLNLHSRCANIDSLTVYGSGMSLRKINNMNSIKSKCVAL